MRQGKPGPRSELIIIPFDAGAKARLRCTAPDRPGPRTASGAGGRARVVGISGGGGRPLREKQSEQEDCAHYWNLHAVANLAKHLPPIPLHDLHGEGAGRPQRASWAYFQREDEEPTLQ
jgi:hypothetical protein